MVNRPLLWPPGSLVFLLMSQILSFSTKLHENIRYRRSMACKFQKISILVIFCSVTNYHTVSGLNDTDLSAELGRSEIWQGILWVLCLGTHKAEIKTLAFGGGGTLMQRLWGRIYFQTHLGCWQNLVLFSYEIQVAISLLTVG